jgi:hypothetical protein
MILCALILYLTLTQLRIVVPGATFLNSLFSGLFIESNRATKTKTILFSIAYQGSMMQSTCTEWIKDGTKNISSNLHIG